MKILGTGSYLPPKVVTNDDIAKTLDTNDEWIYSHTGIRSRHVAEPGETTATMATKAARSALEAASVQPEEIKLIICASSTGDYNPFPSVSCLTQAALGCVNAGAYDLQAACSGFIYALEMARGYIACHPEDKVLVIGSETLTRVIDWNDRGSCILFGDGAGAVVVGAGDMQPENTQVILGADGKSGGMIVRRGGTCDPEPVHDPKMELHGHEVFAFAVRTLSRTVQDFSARLDIKPDGFDWIFAHQANRRIIEATARRLSLPMEKFYLTLETTANTSAASIPMALDQAVRNGELRDGMLITMIGFGAGLTYGGIACRWPNL